MKNKVPVLYSIMYSFKGLENNKNHAVPSKRCISTEKKSVNVTHFTMKILRTYLYVPSNKKILFVKKYLSLLWVFTDFPFFLLFLNTNTAMTRQLIRTGRRLEAE